jgi:L-fucose dehydrogenase
MDLQLEDKVILVSGGASGIGAAIIRAAAREGAIAVIVDRSAEAAEALRAEIEVAGCRAHAITVDLSAPESCLHAVEETLGRFHRLDALVNNAGINDQIGLESGSPGEYLLSLRHNLLHYYSLAHYALPAIKEARGSIVNIASKTAVTGQGGTSGYASAKGAILALTREWAVELLPYGVRVNAVVPAEVMTPAYRNWLDTFPDPDRKLTGILASIPLGKRMTTAEEIAATVLFLLSPQSGHTTGQHLFVDGGYVHLDRSV